MTIKLHKARRKKIYKIARFSTSDSIQKRLESYGFIPGSIITLLHN